MGVWLKSKTGTIYAQRNGKGHKAPVLAIGGDAVWCSELDPEALKNDKDVEVVPNKAPPPKTYKAPLIKDVVQDMAEARKRNAAKTAEILKKRAAAEAAKAPKPEPKAEPKKAEAKSA